MAPSPLRLRGPEFPSGGLRQQSYRRRTTSWRPVAKRGRPVHSQAQPGLPHPVRTYAGAVCAPQSAPPSRALSRHVVHHLGPRAAHNQRVDPDPVGSALLGGGPARTEHRMFGRELCGGALEANAPATLEVFTTTHRRPPAPPEPGGEGSFRQRDSSLHVRATSRPLCRDRLAACRTDLRHDMHEALLTPCPQDHRRPLLSEQPDHGRANVAGCTGDHGHLQLDDSVPRTSPTAASRSIARSNSSPMACRRS